MDSGNVAWVLVSAALVLFMTPGLAFFYGGMDRTRNVLNMLMMNFYCVLVVPVLWVVLDDSRARAAVVTEIHEGWRQRVGRISVLGGEGFRHWRHLIAELEMWAKAQGANRMEIMGRDWSKVLGRDGYVKTATVVRKPL